MRYPSIVTAITATLMLQAGMAGAQSPPSLAGYWQLVVDCGGGTVGVQTMLITEDLNTGQPSIRHDAACGTIFFEGQAVELASCGFTPTSPEGSIVGSTVRFPATGAFIDSGTLVTPFDTPSFPPCTLVTRYETDSHHELTVVEEAAGSAVRLAGTDYIDAFRLYAPDGSQCYAGGSAQCAIVLRRNEVPIAQDVTVIPFDGSSITFSNVSAGGTANVIQLTDPVAIVPANFQLADAPIFYDVVTTANVSGAIRVCLPYPDADDDGFVDGTTPAMDESMLLLLHEEDGQFVNRTAPDDPPLAPNPDTAANVICAEVGSLSQFVFGASTTSCGNAVVEIGEDCDEGAGSNGAATSCCTATCTFRSAGAVCRPSTGECDGTAEVCSGSDGSCPGDAVAAPGTSCAADGNACTADECDGFGVCGVISGATGCDDGEFCTGGDACNGTACVGGPTVSCDDGDPCTSDACASAACVHPPATDGTSCDDADVCTGGEQCTGGMCGGGVDVCWTGVPIGAAKLVLIDRSAADAGDKLLFVSQDGAITKGAGTDAAAIGVRLELAYDGAFQPETGGTVVGPGADDGAEGWLFNTPTSAKFVNRGAPDGTTVAKVVVLKPGRVVKVLAKGLGDEPLDIATAGAPSGPVTAVLTVENGGEEYRHCTAFAACDYRTSDAGAKLVCRGGEPVGCPAP